MARRRVVNNPEGHALIGALILSLLVAAPADDFRALIDGAAADRQAGNLEAALAKLERAHRLRASPALLNNIGVTLQELGRYREAAAVYRAVVADPRAKRSVVELDRERLRALAPKLDRAWVVRRNEDRVASVQACGRRVGTSELAVDPGTCVLEAHGLDGSFVSVSPVALAAGRRHVLQPWVDPPVRSSAHGATVIDLSSPARIIVDGYALKNELRTGRVWLYLAPGDHAVMVASSPPRQFTVRIRSGAIAELVGLSTPTATAVAPPPPVQVERETSVLPWVVSGSGVALGIVSAVTFSVAGSKHRSIWSSERDLGGAIVGVTQAEAQDIEQSARTLDAVALTTGIAAGVCLVTGAVLALVED